MGPFILRANNKPVKAAYAEAEEQQMSENKVWQIEIQINEHDYRTRALVRLHNRDETGLVGVGLARSARPTRRTPSNRSCPDLRNVAGKR